jgi:alpha-beta hydrolase superfamily lysophospholipase
MRDLVLIWAVVAAASAQELPRHGVIGLQVGGTPPAVQRVVPGGAGEAAGLQSGDVVLAIDGTRVDTGDQFARTVGRHLGGETVRVTVRHGAEEIVRAAVLKPRPFETSPNADVLYREVDVRGSRRRVIVTRPHREGRMPAVLIEQGLGCYSLDGADRKSGYGRIIGALEEKGYVTMRVEKPGEGDSEGPLCTDLTATPDLEAEGWLAGLRALKTYDFVDPAKVFVLGHSMGPVTGSLILGAEPVRGYIAVETVGTSWFEYDLERLRVQAGLRGTPEAADKEVREEERCGHRFFIEKQRPEELARDGCEPVVKPYGAVPYTYAQAVADISLGKQWKDADMPVLVVWGTASTVTTAHQNRSLAELINRWHPGRARYAEVPGMGHDLAIAGGAFAEEFLRVTFAWLDGLGG